MTKFNFSLTKTDKQNWQITYCISLYNLHNKNQDNL